MFTFAEVCRIMARNLGPIVINAFICQEETFRRIFFWKKHQQFGNFCLNSSGTFSEFTRKHGFLTENYQHVYESFPELERKMVVLWQENFNRLSKLRFNCSCEISSGEKVCLKIMNCFITFFRIRLVYYQNFGVKNDFWQKSISTVVKTGLFTSSGTFWGKICFPKKYSMKKLILYFERFFVFFCRTILAWLSETPPCVQMKFLRKNHFFERINVYECFSEV